MTRSTGRHDAIDTVTSYLRLVEARHLEEASKYLAPNPVIVFPGGRQFADLEAQVASSAGRFRRIAKTMSRFDVLVSDGSTVVYVVGDLEGEDAAGMPFSGVRFVDRFELVDGLVATHQVWNDLGERLTNGGADDLRERET